MSLTKHFWSILQIAANQVLCWALSQRVWCLDVMNSGFHIFITIVHAPSGLVTTSSAQPDSLQGEQEGGLEVLAVRGTAGGGVARM